MEGYATTTLSPWPGMPVPSFLRPLRNCVTINQQNVQFYVAENEDYVKRKSMTGSTINIAPDKFYFQMVWERK